MNPLDKLAHAIKPPAQGGDELHTVRRWGVVTAVHATPPSVDVEVDGKSPAYPNCIYSKSYTTPTIGDRVLCWVTGAECLVDGTYNGVV